MKSGTGPSLGSGSIRHDDGTRLFQFSRTEDFPEILKFLREALPSWWNDDVQLVGNMTCGDIIVFRKDCLFLIDHDAMKVFRSRISPMKFFALIVARNTNLDKLVCDSINYDQPEKNRR